jgi:hypothetical protein
VDNFDQGAHPGAFLRNAFVEWRAHLDSPNGQQRGFMSSYTITAVANDGTEYTIVVPSALRRRAADDLSGAGSIAAQASLRTTQGHHVNYLSKGRYSVVVVGPAITVVSNDPGAP